MPIPVTVISLLSPSLSGSRGICTLTGPVTGIAVPIDYTYLSDNVYHHYIPDYQGNILGVINTATRTMEQYSEYYPYGMPFGRSSGAGLNRRKYSGKELVTFGGYNAMDYHARWRPTLYPMFTTPDPLDEINTNTSLYTYCGGDPVNRIDPSGKDYNVIISEESITISARYITSYSSLEAANFAIGKINEQSGILKFTFSTQSELIVLPVIFNLRVEPVSPIMGYPEDSSISRRYFSDTDLTDLNTFQILSDDQFDNNNSGVTIDGKFITVSSSYAEDNTGSHEIGHTLGLKHSDKGLMAPTIEQSNGSFKLNKSDISGMIKNPLKNKVNYDMTDGKRVRAGKGTIINESRYRLDELKKGKVLEENK